MFDKHKSDKNCYMTLDILVVFCLDISNCQSLSVRGALQLELCGSTASIDFFIDFCLAGYENRRYVSKLGDQENQTLERINIW